MIENNREISEDPSVPRGSVAEHGFTFIEVLISMVLLLGALLFVGEANMTSLDLIHKGKINQRATLQLLKKIEQLRVVPIQDLSQGEFEEPSGDFLVQWRIADHTPYFGTKQIQCRVLFVPSGVVIVESIFYRSE